MPGLASAASLDFQILVTEVRDGVDGAGNPAPFLYTNTPAMTPPVPPAAGEFGTLSVSLDFTGAAVTTAADAATYSDASAATPNLAVRLDTAGGFFELGGGSDTFEVEVSDLAIPEVRVNAEDDDGSLALTALDLSGNAIDFGNLADPEATLSSIDASQLIGGFVLFDEQGASLRGLLNPPNAPPQPIPEPASALLLAIGAVVAGRSALSRSRRSRPHST